MFLVKAYATSSGGGGKNTGKKTNIFGRIANAAGRAVNAIGRGRRG